MHRRRRDPLRRFLPNLNYSNEYPPKNTIEPELDHFVQLFADLDNHGLDNFIPSLEPPLEENPTGALIIYQGNMTGRGGGGNNPPPTPDLTFKFPIPPRGANANLKNIPPYALPHFYGLVTEDPDTFLFEFDVLCRSYDYTTDGNCLKLFPSTLNDSALHWLMSLGEDSVIDWDTMKEKFIRKYKDYCRGSYMRGDDIFRMQQKDEESLEDYVGRFLFSLKKSQHNQLSEDS